MLEYEHNAQLPGRVGLSRAGGCAGSGIYTGRQDCISPTRLSSGHGQLQVRVLFCAALGDLRGETNRRVKQMFRDQTRWVPFRFTSSARAAARNAVPAMHMICTIPSSNSGSQYMTGSTYAVADDWPKPVEIASEQRTGNGGPNQTSR